MTKFPIGFWNYPDVNAYGPEEVNRWTRCGITLNMSPTFNYDQEEHRKEKLIAFLDEAHRQNMKLIIRVENLDGTNILKLGREEYRRIFERAYNDFGKHPATYGFYIGDEPVGKEENEACIEAYKIVLEIAPELIPFLNFNPYFPGMEETFLGGLEFPVWAKDFANRSGCRMLCYDCYTQLNPEIEGTDGYFLNLKKYSEMADASGIEFWTTLLCSAHFRYRVPSEDDLRWQLNTAVASGCRGILWFLFYDKLCRNNYRQSPIDEFGEETDTYRSMAHVQKIFHAMYGELIYSLKHNKTYHFERCFGTYDPFPQESHTLIKRMFSKDHLPGILSFFEDKEGKEYAVIVNNSPFQSGRFEFVLDKKVKKIWRYMLNGKRVDDFAVSHHDAIYHEEYDAIHAGVCLAPGQMDIFSFE